MGQRDLLNKMLVGAVLAGLLTWTVLQFLGSGARGEFELWGIGRATGALEAVMFVFLMLNHRQLRRPTPLTVVVIAWIPWVVLNVSVFVDGEILDWLTSGPFAVLLWPLTYLFFYTLVRASGSLWMLKRYFLFVSVACVALFFAVFDSVNAGRTSGYQQLNAVYYPLLTLPWVTIARRPAWRIIGVLLVVIAVSYSLKRTALVALALAAAAYVVVAMRSRFNVSRVRGIISIIALLVVSGVAYVRVDEALGDAFSDRLLSSRDDAGSNRLAIYRDVIEGVADARVENLLFGHGHYRSLDSFGITAHNDFLETVYDYGILGLILYCLIHVALLRTAFALVRERSPVAPAFALSYAVFFAMSMTSHLIIYPTYFAYLVAFWAAVEAIRRNEKEQRALPLRGALRTTVPYVTSAAARPRRTVVAPVVPRQTI